MSRISHGLLIATASCLLLVHPASANTVVYDNIGPNGDCYICNGNPFTNPVGYAIGGPFDVGHAFRFNTGSVSGYLDQITLALVVSQESSIPQFEQLTAFIYDDDSAFVIPANELYSESYSIPPSDIFPNIIFTLQTSRTFYLEEGTTYWVAFAVSSDSSLGWIYNQDINLRGDVGRQLGGTWLHLSNATAPGLRITTIPVPAALWLLGSALGVLLFGRLPHRGECC